MSNIIEQVANAFAESDAEAIADAPNAVREARQQYREMMADYYEIPYREQGKRQQQMAAVRAIFSKRFIEDFDWGEAEHIQRQIKQVKKAHAARNERIVAKFNKAGIESINEDNFKVVYGKNFEGVWIIDGFRVKIEVILAGGYNIQRLHQRVLVSIKKAA